MPTPPASFPLFRRLPYELRDAIWEASLPARLVRCSPVHGQHSGRPPPPAAPVFGVRSIPSIAHACAHARAVACRSGRWLDCPRHRTHPVWFDRDRDTVLLAEANPFLVRVLLPTDIVAGPVDNYQEGYCFDCFRPAAGGFAVHLGLPLARHSRRLLTSLLPPHGAAAAFDPVRVYFEEIRVRGPRAAAAASGLFHLPHAPAAAAAAAGGGHFWRLVPLDDTATLRRMQAFSHAMAQRARHGHGHGHRRHADADAAADDTSNDDDDGNRSCSRVDGNAGFFRALLLTDHRARNAQRLESFYVNAALGTPETLELVRQFKHVVLVVFEADDDDGGGGGGGSEG